MVEKDNIEMPKEILTPGQEKDIGIIQQFMNVLAVHLFAVVVLVPTAAMVMWLVFHQLNPESAIPAAWWALVGLAGAKYFKTS